MKRLSSNRNIQEEEIVGAKLQFTKSRAILQNLKRRYFVSKDNERDEKLVDILDRNPRSLMSSTKASKKDSITLNKLFVGKDVFTGKDVGRGFFTSIKNLKSRDHNSLDSCPTFQDFITEHKHVLEICKQGEKIPQLTFD